MVHMRNSVSLNVKGHLLKHIPLDDRSAFRGTPTEVSFQRPGSMVSKSDPDISLVNLYHHLLHHINPVAICKKSWHLFPITKGRVTSKPSWKTCSIYSRAGVQNMPCMSLACGTRLRSDHCRGLPLQLA